MNLTFEYLKEEDLEEVVQLYDAERPVVTNREKMKKTFSKIKNNKDYKMIVVKENNNLIGFAKAVIHHDIFEENRPFVTIWSLRVKASYRQRGVATKLFEYIENMAKNLDCEFICLLADKENIPANNLYQKLGYQQENGYIKVLGRMIL